MVPFFITIFVTPYPISLRMKQRVKYKYNPETLQYEKIELTLNQLLIKVLKYISIGLLIAGLIVLLSFPFIKDYSTREAQKEIKVLEGNYKEIDQELDKLVIVLDGLKETDNDLYRVIFSAEPFRHIDINKDSNLNLKNHTEFVFAIQDKISQLKRKMAYQSISFDEVIKLAVNKEKMLTSIPSIMPIADKDLTRLSSGFGYRIDPIYGVPRFHAGLDFTSPTGSEIHSSGDGVVEKIGYSKGGYGNEIIVNHGYGYKSHYAHLSKFANIKVGQKVKRGEVIGYVGSTGKSTAPHLHYEIIKNGNKIDPINFFFNDITPEQYEQMIEKSLNTGASLD